MDALTVPIVFRRPSPEPGLNVEFPIQLDIPETVQIIRWFRNYHLRMKGDVPNPLISRVTVRN